MLRRNCEGWCNRCKQALRYKTALEKCTPAPIRWNTRTEQLSTFKRFRQCFCVFRLNGEYISLELFYFVNLTGQLFTPSLTDWLCCLTSTGARRPIRDGVEWEKGERRVKPPNRRQPHAETDQARHGPPPERWQNVKVQGVKSAKWPKWLTNESLVWDLMK